MRHRQWRTAQVQRQAQRRHVVAIAAQDALGQRKKALLLVTGMRQVGPHQGVHLFMVQIDRFGPGGGPDCRLQLFPAYFEYPVFCSQALHHGLRAI